MKGRSSPCGLLEEVETVYEDEMIAAPLMNEQLMNALMI